jgi:2-dehydropantoate 2-reductase
MKVGILGAGALGSLLAYRLARRTAASVRLLARNGHPGWVAVEGDRPVPVEAGPPAGPVDLLVVLVKAYDTAGALAWAKGAVGPYTVGLTLQNGLGNAEALAGVLGPDRVLAGTTAQGATLLGPGRVAHGGNGPTRIAPWTPGGAAALEVERVAALFNRAGLAASTAADARPLLWAKLAVNCAINPLTAILRVTNGQLLERPDARRLMEAAAREAGAVAAACGVRLREEPVAQAIAVAGATAANRSSMLQDVERGRRTEIDAISGAVARLGAEHGVGAPVNATLAELVRALEA